MERWFLTGTQINYSNFENEMRIQISWFYQFEISALIRMYFYLHMEKNPYHTGLL